MVLKERIRVKATAGRVWTILRDPGRMSQWNPRCVESVVDEDTMRIGLRFQATMRFSGGPERQLDGEVVECEPDRVLTLRFSGAAGFHTGEYVDETYVMQPIADGTKVLHTVDFSHSGLPGFLQAFLKVFQLVGRREGRSALEGLKELAEEAQE